MLLPKVVRGVQALGVRLHRLQNKKVARLVLKDARTVPMVRSKTAQVRGAGRERKV